MSPLANKKETKQDKNEKKKKRKRTDDSGIGQKQKVDIPEIPGIPMDIVPVHIQSIKVTGAYFRKCVSKKQFVLKLPTNGDTSNNKNNESVSEKDCNYDRENRDFNKRRERESGSVVENLLNRVDEVVEREHTRSEEGRMENQMKERMNQTIQSWLQAIHRWLRENKHDTDQVPIAIFKHLLELSIEHAKISIRRAVTYLMGHILFKSAACRRWWLQQEEEDNGDENSIIGWMDAVSELSTASASTTTPAARFCQVESFHLLQLLHTKFNDFYPTLGVALQRFRQQIPEVVMLNNENSTDITATNGHPEMSTASSVVVADMETRRRIRDLAMQKAFQEERKVRKLIASAFACTDILVPRMTTEKSNQILVQGAAEQKSEREFESDDDDDDDSVDWEDGQEKTTSENSDTEDHVAAVERTLLAMKSAGGLTGGELEIDFARNDDKKESSEEIIRVRDRLKQIAQVLSERHVPRLSKWVDALTQADALVHVSEQTQQKASGKTQGLSSLQQALVRMSEQQLRKRQEILLKLTDLKRQVASVLSSASRLELGHKIETSTQQSISESQDDSVENANVQLRVRRSLALSSSVASAASSTGKSNLAANIATRNIKMDRLARSRDFTRKRSNRIQIKYRKGY